MYIRFTNAVTAASTANLATAASTAATYIIGHHMSWPAWIEDHNAATGNVVWNGWIATPSRTRQYQPTVEQLRAQLEERARVRERAAEAERERIAARDRARDLLHALLREDQRGQLLARGYFDVIGSRGRHYRIYQGTHGNVRVVNANGREITRLCAQPTNVPTEDAMLAQKLMIEANEDEYLRVANATAM